MKYREDIDGLRAIAVLPVVLFHAGAKWFSGGFVGVDIFFVISGFLITGLIAAEIKEDRFTIGKFYERRIRRSERVLRKGSRAATFAAHLVTRGRGAVLRSHRQRLFIAIENCAAGQRPGARSSAARAGRHWQLPTSSSHRHLYRHPRQRRPTNRRRRHRNCCHPGCRWHRSPEQVPRGVVHRHR